MHGMSEKSPIERAADSVGGATKLAAILGVSLQVVGHWKARGVPIERCVAIERATAGAVTRRDLRPKDYSDIWPELAGQPKRTPRKQLAQQ